MRDAKKILVGLSLALLLCSTLHAQNDFEKINSNVGALVSLPLSPTSKFGSLSIPVGPRWRRRLQLLQTSLSHRRVHVERTVSLRRNVSADSGGLKQQQHHRTQQPVHASRKLPVPSPRQAARRLFHRRWGMALPYAGFHEPGHLRQRYRLHASLAMVGIHLRFRNRHG
jgi:hypothetical protein